MPAILAYVPLLASSPGRVGADTKTYLYLDPGRLLAQARWLWDADVALGTVTHQTIGYLWPMGPFYWVLEMAGSPDWLSQRLWLGSILLAAALGVRYLLRTLEWAGPGLVLAMVAYELSPYLLDYSARISVVLLPWAGLPWLLGLTIRATRSGGWRHPALFALVAVTVGSVNATSLVLVGLGPVLWLAHAVWAERSVPLGRALGTAARIGVLSVGVSLWWMVGLVVQGLYSLPVTRYTETYEVVADASTAPEILRGLGYWFFYGNDKFGPWIEPSVDYTQGVWLIFVTFGLVVLALACAALVRWRHRSFFLLLLVVGALIGVGSHPYDSPSLLGALFKEVTLTDAGLALRSTPRAVPLVVLSTSVLLGTGVGALARRWPRWWRPCGAVILIAVVLANPPIWKTRMIERHLDRDEHIPDYWLEAAAALDRDETGTRVWEIPGSDFASYRWGNTVDPITPGLMERGYVARELVPFGSARSAALLSAFDRRLQEDSVDLDAFAPVARLMSVGSVIHRADLTYERFRTPRPETTEDLLQRSPGLTRSIAFGEPVPNVAGPEQTLLDEIHLAMDPRRQPPNPVTSFDVTDPLPVIRTRPVAGSMILAGDLDGLIDAAGAGLLDLERTVVFAADLLSEEAYREALSVPTEVVVTDTNRRRARRWGTIREVYGYTEQAGTEPLRHDPTDNRLPVFEQADDEARTVSEHRGPISVQASAYGNPVTYTPDDRAVHAVDGDLDTAWTVAAFAEARGERLVLELDRERSIEELTLVQPQIDAVPNRHITEIEITADGRAVARVDLDERSRRPPGQVVTLDVAASILEIQITDTDMPRRATYPGVSPVGFAEIDLGLEPVQEVIRMPRALLAALGPDLEEHDLSFVLTRERSNPREPVRDDPEPAMTRALTLPDDREFEITGAVRLSPLAPSETIDRLLGLTVGLDGVGLRARSSGSLPGDLPSRPSAVLDADPSTAWTGEFGPQNGQWLEIDRDEPIQAELIALEVVVDRLHSVPETVRLVLDGVEHGTVETGLGLEDNEADTIRRVEIPLPVPARTVRLVMESVIERTTRDWYSNELTVMPVSLAEVDLGVGFGPTADLATGCRDDLITVAGSDVPVVVTGTSFDAVGRYELELAGCEPVNLSAGETLIVTAAGRDTGLDVDQVVLHSARAVEPAPVQVAVDSTRHSDVRFTVTVPPADHERWLVLGQSNNEGWRATVDGRDLGDPLVVDGFANAWRVPAGEGWIVELEWMPQRLVDRALVVSALMTVVAVVLVGLGRRDEEPLFEPPGGEPGEPVVAPLPLLGRDRVTSVRVAIAVGLATAVFAVLNLPQWFMLAPVLGAATAVCCRSPRLAGVLPLGAALSLGLAALWVMAEQTRLRHPPDFVWPQQFEEVHMLGVVAILLLGGEYLRASAASRVSEPDSATEPD